MEENNNQNEVSFPEFVGKLDDGKKKDKKGLKIFLIIVIILALVAGVLMFFYKDEVLKFINNMKTSSSNPVTIHHMDEGDVDPYIDNENYDEEEEEDEDIDEDDEDEDEDYDEDYDDEDYEEENEPVGEIIVDKDPIVYNMKSSYKITKNELDDFDLVFLQLENNNKNVVYSPLSIKYSLGMLMEGANNESKAQIEKFLGDYNFHKYTNSKNMSFANALFIKNSFKESIVNSYTTNIKNKFNAEVVYDSFKDPKVINDYVSNKTFKLIKNVVDDISQNDFILANALAINMEWVKKLQSYDDVYSVYFPHLDFGAYIRELAVDDYHKLLFYDSETKKQSVEIGAVINKYDIVGTLGKDTIKKTVQDEYNKWIKEGAPNACEECSGESDCKKKNPFNVEEYIKELNSNYKHVSKSTDFSLYVDDDVKVFKKNLKKYGDTTLTYVAIMPMKVSLKRYINDMDASSINSLIKKAKSISFDNFKDGVITNIHGYIPLFNYNYELNLKEDLNKLGITDIFEEGKADLSNLTTTESYISDALHKTNIDFSNDGIKAASVTLEGGRGGGDCGFDFTYKPPVEDISITFNRPYIYLVMDKDSGEVWFVGSVYNPSDYSSIFGEEDD